MKKLTLLFLTVAGGLYVQTATPERPEREQKQPRQSKCNKKQADYSGLSKHINFKHVIARNEAISA